MALALVTILSASLGRASAAGEEPSGYEQLGATAAQTKAALESPTTQPIAAPAETDPTAAAELPHTDLDRGEALGLAEAVFGSEIEGAAGIFGELEPERLLSDNAAVVPASSLPGTPGEGGSPEGPEARVLVESLLPLRTDNGEGETEAVDLGLEPAEGELRPTNPLVEVGVPTQAAEEVSLPGAEVGIALAEAPATAATSAAEGEFAFYPETAEDTDLIVAPTPLGVETMTDVRSAAAPQQTTYELSLPAGAELAATAEGGAEVVKDGQRTVTVPPPTAIDAAGEPVPVAMSVEGDALTVAVTPIPTTAYPILVDPRYITEVWNWTSLRESFGGWRDSEAEPASPAGYKPLEYAYWEYIGGNPNYALGLDVSSSSLWGGAAYGAHDWWVYTVPRWVQEVVGEKRPPPTTWIHQLYTENLWFRTEGNPAAYPALVVGLAEPGTPQWWAPGDHYRYGYEGDLSSYNGFTTTNTAEAHSVKAAEMDFITYEAEYPSKRRDAYIGGASIALGDPDAPSVTLTGPTRWLTGSAPVAVPYTLEDKGLGVIWAELRPAGGGIPQRISATGFDHCYGTVGAPCPRLAKSTEAGRRQLDLIPAQLPTGEDGLEVVAEDPLGGAGHTTSHQFTVKVDNRAPTVSVSGPLTEQATLGDRLTEYKLSYTARDGTSGAPQSGAARTEVRVDGKVQPEATRAPGCGTKDCQISGEWTLDASRFPYGKHTVEVVATDAVGLKTIRSIPIELLDVQTPPVAAYSFDEDEGTVAHDASGAGHDGTISTQGVTWAPGRYGTALQFDGSKGCVTIPDSAALRLREEFTLEAWVRPEGELLHLPAITKQASGFPAYGLGVGMSTAGKAEGQIGTEAGGTSSVSTTGASLEANVWRHEALTYDGDKLRLYLDGAVVGEKAVEKTASAALGPLEIGCSAAQHFRGRIDNVRVYNRALEAGEVAVDRLVPIQDPQAAPVASYPLDEDEGTVVHDTSGDGHEGTFVGEGISWVPGRYGSGLRFEGKGYVNIPDSTALQLGEGFTIEAWVRPEGEPTHDPAIAKVASGFTAYGLGVGMTTTGKAEGQIGTEAGGTSSLASTASLEANVWQHEALTYDGSTLRLYVNGLPVAEKVVGKGASAAAGPLRIGGSAEQRFMGRVDEVRIYNRALEAGEVAADREAPIQTPKAGPVAAWSFDEAADPARDSVEGGPEGTLSAEGWKSESGRYGSALGFDGAKGCLTVPSTEALQLGEEFTLESWVRPEGELTHLPILWKAGEGYPSYDLGIGLTTAGRGEAQIGTAGGSHTDAATPAAMNPGVWQHLAVTFDGARLRLYLEGNLVTTKPVTGPASGAPGALTIGCGNGWHFRGRVDEVRIYNRALEPAEVAISRGSPIQTPQAGPVAAWSFDEAADPARDSVEGGPEGTLSAEGWKSESGRYGSALGFDGAEGCLTVPSTEALQLAEEFTLESWVRPEGELTHLPILWKAGEGFPSYDLGIGLTTAGRGEGQIGTTGKSHTDAPTTEAMAANVWQHLAVTFDGAKLRLYLEENLVTTKPVTGPASGAPGALTIGCGNGWHFRGRIDEVRIYNRALEPAEVAISRGSPIQTPQAAPVAAWSFEEGEGTTTHDISGGAHDGTLSSEGVYWAPGRYGPGLKFDGSKGCVTVPDSEALRLKEDFTLEAWVKPEGGVTADPAIVKRASGFPAYGLGVGLTTAGRAEGQIGTESGSHSDAVSSNSVEVGAWNHEALTFDGTHLRLYLNGELVATKAVEKTNSVAFGNLMIGCNSTQHFKGRIDEVRIYNRALNDAEAEDTSSPTFGGQFGAFASLMDSSAYIRFQPARPQANGAAVPGPISTYRYRYAINGGSLTEWNETRTTSFVISGTQPGDVVEIQVFAENAGGNVSPTEGTLLVLEADEEGLGPDEEVRKEAEEEDEEEEESAEAQATRRFKDSSNSGSNSSRSGSLATPLALPPKKRAEDLICVTQADVPHISTHKKQVGLIRINAISWVECGDPPGWKGWVKSYLIRLDGPEGSYTAKTSKREPINSASYYRNFAVIDEFKCIPGIYETVAESFIENDELEPAAGYGPGPDFAVSRYEVEITKANCEGIGNGRIIK